MRTASALALSLFLSSAWAYVLSGSRWPSPQTSFVYDLVHPRAGRTSSSGISWNQAFAQAMARWNERTVFTFHGQPGTSADPCREDGLNTAAFRRDECGFAFGSTTLGITYSFFSSGHLRETDIVFNADEAWDVYDGPLRQAFDFTRVAVHELGHALGLDHENRLPAIMASQVGDLSLPQKDDLQGVAALYGGPPPLPAACQAQALPLNAWIQGQLEASDCRRLDIAESAFASDDSAIDLYALELPTPGLLVVQMHSDQLDPYLEIRQGQKILASSDDFGGSGTNALLYVHLPPGRYQLVANSAAPWLQTGDYRLKVSIGLDQSTARLEEDWSLTLAAVEVAGLTFQAKLTFYPHPDDPQGFYWRLHSYHPLPQEAATALLLPNTLDLVLNPVEALGKRFDVLLKRVFLPQDPAGWYFKLDQVFERN
jgi:hypothetical protein